MAKGAGFEREMAKLFSLWWTNNQDDNIFWRTSNSGGRAGMRTKQGKSTAGQYGDMGATNPIGKPLIDFFTFEFKRGYQNSVLHDFFDHPKGNEKTLRTWEKWVGHVYLEHKKAESKTWIIIHRRNGRIPLAVVPVSMFSIHPFSSEASKELVKELSPKFKAVILIRKKVGEPHKKFSVFGTPLDNMLRLLEALKPKRTKGRLKNG